MTKHLSTLIFSSITLSYLTGLTGCGGSGGIDTTIPKSVIKDISDNNYTITRGGKLILNGSESTDDKKIIKYTWLIDDELVSDKVTDELVVRLSAGTHKVCLTTEDEDKKTNQTCKTITVIEPKIKTPTAVINNIPSSGWKTKCKITLDGKESTAIFERTIKSYKWYKDNTLIGTDVNQTFSFDKASKHHISLEVVDDMNNSNKITKKVLITDIGKPTVNLKILNPYQREIFPIDSGITNKFNIPEGNLVFLSAEGSFDDCNLTDDNLTYIWDGKIYKSNGQDPVRDHCFAQKPTLAKIHRDFNTTKFNYESFATILETDTTDYKEKKKELTKVSKDIFNKTKYIYPYPYEQPRMNGGQATDLAPSKEINTPYVYIELCNGKILDYDRLEIKLTVKDNLHNLQTDIIKTIKIKEAKQ